jgi:hypothetical protein
MCIWDTRYLDQSRVAQREACCDTCFGFGGQVIGVGEMWLY